MKIKQNITDNNIHPHLCMIQENIYMDRFWDHIVYYEYFKNINPLQTRNFHVQINTYIEWGLCLQLLVQN